MGVSDDFVAQPMDARADTRRLWAYAAPVVAPCPASAAYGWRNATGGTRRRRRRRFNISTNTENPMEK